MRNLVSVACALLNAETGTYGLLIDGKMVFSEYIQNGEVRSNHIVFEKGVGIPGWVMQIEQPYIANDAASAPHVLPELQQTYGFYNLINFPVFNRTGDLVACFEIQNKVDHQPFTEEDLDLLQALASSAAIAFENAQMIEEQRALEQRKNEIIRQHKGRLWVNSRKGEGATFSFALPVWEG